LKPVAVGGITMVGAGTMVGEIKKLKEAGVGEREGKGEGVGF